jgi:hypothetical protein
MILIIYKHISLLSKLERKFVGLKNHELGGAWGAWGTWGAWGSWRLKTETEIYFFSFPARNNYKK